MTNTSQITNIPGLGAKKPPENKRHTPRGGRRTCYLVVVVVAVAAAVAAVVVVVVVVVVAVVLVVVVAACTGFVSLLMALSGVNLHSALCGGLEHPAPLGREEPIIRP